MNNTIKSYQLEIFGNNYTLLSDESEQHVIKSAQLVDTYMNEIAEKVPIENHQRIAVLAAIRLASILLYKEVELDGYKLEIEKMVQLISRQISENSSIVP